MGHSSKWARVSVRFSMGKKGDVLRVTRFPRERVLLGVGLFREGMGGNVNEPELEPEPEGDDGAEGLGEERRVDGKGVESERWVMEGPAAFSMHCRVAPFLSLDS